MGPLGMGEIIVIFILALLIFGPKKLPELGKTFGKGMAEFKRASNELKSTFQREMDNIEKETREVKTLAGDVSKDIDASYYDDGEEDYYDAYDYDGGAGTKTSGSSAAANGAAGEPDSTGDEAADKDSTSMEASGSAAAAAAETPSEDSSSAGAVEAAEVPVAAVGADGEDSKQKTA